MISLRKDKTYIHIIKENSILFSILMLLALIFPTQLLASDISLPGVNISFDDVAGEEPQDIASALQILALMTVLSLAPALMVILTSFTRIIIVLSMLRHAFGMQQTPPNIVIISLALFLTLFTMTPVLENIEANALEPLSQGEMTTSEAAKAAMVPVRAFMISQTREKDIALIIELSGEQLPDSVDDIKNTVLIPAFMLSELQTAFQIGFVIFLPFLAIDLIAASVLMAMGMIMVPPLTISLPIKVLMFVLIEGWALVTQALVGSFL